MRASAAEKAFSACSQRRHHHFVEQQRSAERRAVDLVGRAGRAQDIVGGDAALLAGKFVAAARPRMPLRIP